MTREQCDEILNKLRSVPATFAAELIGVSPQTLAGWRKRGRITGTQERNSARWRYDVVEFLMRQATPKAEA